MKKAISVCCVLIIVFQLFVGATYAAAPEEMTPYYTGVYSVGANLKIVNETLGKSESQAVAILRAGYTAEVTMTLKQISVGSVEELKTWNDSLSATGEIKHTYYIPSGYGYTLIVSMDIYDSDGDFVETIVTNDSITY